MKRTSMFHAIDETRIDRGLYPTTMETESSYDEEAGFCGSLKLALSVDTNLNLLTVSIKQAIDLVAKRQVECQIFRLRVFLLEIQHFLRTANHPHISKLFWTHQNKLSRNTINKRRYAKTLHLL
jgi:hypothetical protein